MVVAEFRNAFDLARVMMADPEDKEFAVEFSGKELLDEELHPSGQGGVVQAMCPS
ncbi:hypothetical protein [Streptomyces sp. NPDC102437]|uniref:hypothetical protein n=1 Tax=Streptomyces sp. NPDC102437 TaxID=3366175 RepID=UPI0037F313EC